MNQDLFIQLLQTLDSPQWRYKQLESYYTGTQPLSYINPEDRAAMGDRLARMVANIPRLAVTSLAERLRITGFAGADVWSDWLRLDLDMLSSAAMRDALLFGQSFVIAWADNDGQPLVTVESPKQVAVMEDPGTRIVTSAVKRWRTRTTTEAVMYLPDQVIRLRADTPGVSTAGFYVVETLDNPLGVVPVVAVRNSDLISVYWPNANGVTDTGHSEISDLMPLVDGLAKLLTDMMVSSEYSGRPRRYATGIDLAERPVLNEDGSPALDEYGVAVVETVSPFPEQPAHDGGKSRRQIWPAPRNRSGLLPQRRERHHGNDFGGLSTTGTHVGDDQRAAAVGGCDQGGRSVDYRQGRATPADFRSGV